MHDGKWYQHDGLSLYEKLCGELSVTEGGVLLRGNRIVVPHSLQCTLVDAAHEGHQGIVKTKSLLRAKVWFLGMDSLVDRVVSSCSACATVSKDERRHGVYSILSIPIPIPIPPNSIWSIQIPIPHQIYQFQFQFKIDQFQFNSVYFFIIYERYF